MPKQIPQPIRERVIQLYTLENLSAVEVMKKLRQEGVILGQAWIRHLLKTNGLMRTFSQTMKISNGKKSFERTCSGCQSAFSSRQKNGKYCKSCAPDDRSWRRLAIYGVSQQQYQELLSQQQHACAICQTPFANIPIHKNKESSVFVDHDHSTGTVRGLLCQECNVTLGYIEKRPVDWTNKILRYLGRVN